MSTTWTTAALLAASVAWAAPASAQDDGLEARLARVEQRLSEDAAPSAREIQSSVDAYLASRTADPTLVGGPGSAGYDGGFWIRGGSFLLKINLTIQARFEAFRWDDNEDEPGAFDNDSKDFSHGGDLSGFSVPRITVKLSGDATCNVHYYVEHECGHAVPAYGRAIAITAVAGLNGYAAHPSFEGCREAWIEYDPCPAFRVRMGLVKLAATRQLMTPPELQQFVDVSMASAWIGHYGIGYTDRNRDYGVAFHGVLGCDGAWSYLFTVTNGDGPTTRNVLDTETNDNLAYSARINWDVRGHMGYEEGALRQHECGWALAVGAWAYAYTDILYDQRHTGNGDDLGWGFDLAAGWGGWSATAAINYWSNTSDPNDADYDGWSYLAQIGYLFPCTAWEVAARMSWYVEGYDGSSGNEGGSEIAFAVNYYIDGHSDKLTLDVALIDDAGEDYGNYLYDTYAAYWRTYDGTAVLIRFQWQLAL